MISWKYGFCYESLLFIQPFRLLTEIKPTPTKGVKVEVNTELD